VWRTSFRRRVRSSVSLSTIAGAEQMSELGHALLPLELVKDDFNAIGRMNGGVQPSPPKPANCLGRRANASLHFGTCDASVGALTSRFAKTVRCCLNFGEPRASRPCALFPIDPDIPSRCLN